MKMIKKMCNWEEEKEAHWVSSIGLDSMNSLFVNGKK
jgi:hypothetical protein